MAWLRIDDGFTEHPKLLALTPRDRWTWLRILSYCARYRTSGRVPSSIGEAIAGVTPALLRRLLALGLLEPVENSVDEYRVHDFEVYNTPRNDEVAALVRQAVDDHPNASANELFRLIGGSRNQVLKLIQQYRSGTDNGTPSVPQRYGEVVSRAPAGAFPSPRSTTKEGAVTTRASSGDPDEHEPGPGERPRDSFIDPTGGAF